MIYIIFEILVGLCLSILVIYKMPRLQILSGKLAKMCSFIACLFYPIISIFLINYPWRDSLDFMAKRHLLLNYIIMSLIFIFLALILPRIQWSIYITFILATIMGVANTEVIAFRFYPIAPVDILSIRTAAAVAEGYNIFINNKIFITFAVMFLSIIFVGIQKEFWEDLNQRLKTKKAYAFRLPAAALVCFAAYFWIANVDFYESYWMMDYSWEPVQTYSEYGFSLSFCAELHRILPNKPKGYDKQTALDIVEAGAREFDNNHKEYKVADAKSPIVLVIMNESFTDYDMLGEFNANDEYLSFYHSLKDDPGTKEYGYLYTSTYGGGTYKSEFECLTGCSMTNISGKLPYMMFDFYNMDSLVSSFKSEGYTAVAAHPSFPTNWKRKTVYENLGFDDFLDVGDFDFDENDDPRGYLNDMDDYKRMVEEMQSHTEPLFLFNVTIQNHGGYNENELGQRAIDIDQPYNVYSDARIFAGDMQMSDQALEYLFGEIKQMDRPVTVCFYGDHQPALNEEFVNTVIASEAGSASNNSELEQRRYITPYFIWSNDYASNNTYDAPKLDSAGVNIISPTYLGVMGRYYNGNDLTDYDKYLISLRDKVAMMNIAGIYTADEGFVSIVDMDNLSDDTKKCLDDYAYVEYLKIYDK